MTRCGSMGPLRGKLLAMTIIGFRIKCGMTECSWRLHPGVEGPLGVQGAKKRWKRVELWSGLVILEVV